MNRYYITKTGSDSAMCYPETPTPTVVVLYGMNGADFKHYGNVRGYVHYEDALPPATVRDFGLIPGTIPTYHTISEETARRSHEMMSMRDYPKGSATASYQRMVDKACAIADYCKAHTDPLYHDRIDDLYVRYNRKLAENLNESYRIGTMCPSVMISGAGNFPVKKKEKQNARDRKNLEEFMEIQGLLDKMESVGKGGISSDDPNAIPKLKAKLENLEKSQELMKSINAYYRKHKTLDNCPGLTPEMRADIEGCWARGWNVGIPFPGYSLSTNNANIKRTKDRIAELEKRAAAAPADGWEFDGGTVEANTEENRLQIFFDGKPDEDVRKELKSNGFHWSPRNGCWQRQLTDNAISAARRLFPC